MSEIIYILVLLQYSNLKDTLIRIVYVFSYKKKLKKNHSKTLYKWFVGQSFQVPAIIGFASVIALDLYGWIYILLV